MSQGGNAHVCRTVHLHVDSCGEKRSFATFISIMVKNCIAANCSNTYGHGVNFSRTVHYTKNGSRMFRK